MIEKGKTTASVAVSGIRDNHHRGDVAEFLRAKIQSGSRLSVVSAYFTIYAYDALRENLDWIEHLDFLFGEPRFIKSLDPDKTATKAFVLDGNGLQLTNRLEQKRVARDCADWIRKKVDIRSVRHAQLLHGKMYHIAKDGVEEAILGSSNFTMHGLGLATGNSNIELNLVVDSNRDRQDLKQWFYELWNDPVLVEDVKQEVLQYLDQLYANQSPQFIYYLTLFHLFRDYLDGTRDLDENLRQVALPDTRIWRTLFSFQKDGAKAAINKILDFNGCILADSVGLGKTYTALAVIKYFELRNERVLVLCPKKLGRNWTIFRNPSSLNPFSDDKFRYDVLHHTDLSRESGEVNGLFLDSLNWGAYDLVVIDESHNFRNNKLATQRPGETTERRSRYQRLMEDIISAGVRTKVLLLSATPVNNQLADLRNQISFIAGGDVARNDAADAAFTEKLGIASVRETSRQAQAQFTNWAKKPPAKRKTRELLAAIGGDFFKLLDGLSIARSRRQVASYYAGEMKQLGGFPHRPPPKAVHAPIDLQQRFLAFEQLDKEISALRLALYHPTSFLRDDLPANIRAGYENKILGGFTQEGRERILIAMMKVNFLKRLESSVDSFRLTSDEQAKLTCRAFFPEDAAKQTFAGKTLTLDDICYISKGMVVHADEELARGAFKLEDVVSEHRDEKHPKPFVESKHLARWLPMRRRWLEWGTDRAPALFSRPTFRQIYTVPEKLISVDMAAGVDSLQVAYDDEQLFHNHSAWSFVPWHLLEGVRNRPIAAFGNHPLTKGMVVMNAEWRSKSSTLAFVIAIKVLASQRLVAAPSAHRVHGEVVKRCRAKRAFSGFFDDHEHRMDPRLQSRRHGQRDRSGLRNPNLCRDRLHSFPSYSFAIALCSERPGIASSYRGERNSVPCIEIVGYSGVMTRGVDHTDENINVFEAWHAKPSCLPGRSLLAKASEVSSREFPTRT